MWRIISKLIDLTGKKFGRLTVLYKVGSIRYNKCTKTVWHCICDCTNEIDVVGELLRTGKTKSCGCLKKEIAYNTGKNNKKENKYDLATYQYGVGYTNDGKVFYFDKEDYEKIKDICWWEDENIDYPNLSYICGLINGKKVKMHRYILGLDSGDNYYVDHINHKTYDNQKENLRLVDSSKNQMNRSISKNNTSGVTGVFWKKEQNKWCATIRSDKYKIKHLGYFDNFDDAVRVRKNAEEIYYGDYSYDNSMKHINNVTKIQAEANKVIAESLTPELIEKTED